MLEILDSHPRTRHAVRIIGAFKRQFFHMITQVFDNSNLSQEIFAIDTWRAVIYSFGHGGKHMLAIFPTVWRPGFTVEIDLRATWQLTVNAKRQNLGGRCFDLKIGKC